MVAATAVPALAEAATVPATNHSSACGPCRPTWAVTFAGKLNFSSILLLIPFYVVGFRVDSANDVLTHAAGYFAVEAVAVVNHRIDYAAHVGSHYGGVIAITDWGGAGFFFRS